MKLVLTKQLLLTTAILLAGTACTNENNEGLPGNPSSPSDGDATNRREVLVTIKNKLTVTPTGTKAGEIATAEENKISSLDIYVFGAETADGTYTFQERFAYREDPAVTIPAGATSIDLTQEGDGKEASVSMKLKKGLFVKLYAIANQTGLVDPTGQPILDGDFKPLVLTNPGQQGTTVLTVGVPTEAEFLAFHSPLLDATTEEDILNTPLPMSGANTVPTDLTDFEAFARIQASFKLTRTVARFDVVNNAADSRFTISKISMGNARKGCTFFPITPTGAAPADAADLITMPARDFEALADANAGTTLAAFYSYPSPKEDNGYIILTGKYKMNNTDEGKDVSYQIPFKQEVNGNGSYIEISPNHRYTIAITKADDYHLDFNLTVADWADEGDVDGFEPTEPTPTLPGNIVTIDQSILTSYKMIQNQLAPLFFPFNADGTDQYHGCTVDITAGTMIGSYTIQVEKEQRSGTDNYPTIQSYCQNLDKDGLSDWRIPTLIELHAIYINRSTIESTGISPFFDDYYWSSSFLNGRINSNPCMLSISNSNYNWDMEVNSHYVRCVRDFDVKSIN